MDGWMDRNRKRKGKGEEGGKGGKGGRGFMLVVGWGCGM